MKILVIDDEEAIRESLDMVLRFEHHDVLLAENGDRGLAVLEQAEGIELVFCDIKMPGRDGLEILEEIHRAEPQLPVVMISGRTIGSSSRPAGNTT